MSGLRTFACDRCGTVFSGLDRPPYCDECEDGSLGEITRELRRDDYFTRAMSPRRRPRERDAD